MTGTLSDLLMFINFTNLFRATERAIWFSGVREPERNGEHTFQLAMCAWFLNERLSLGLDVTRLLSYALVHDLVETYAADTPAFVNIVSMNSMQNSGSAVTRSNKDQREREALERIRLEWSEKFPSMVEYMDRYLDHADPESQFVYALDKLVASLNIYDDGGRSFRLLGLTLEMVDAYQRPKIGADETILALYEELYALLQVHEDDLFSPIVPGSMTIGGPQ